MLKNFARTAGSIFQILVAMSLAGCGGGGGGGGSLTPPIGSVSGVWQITETAKTSNNPSCAAPTSPLQTYIALLTQNGNSINAQVGIDTTSPFDASQGSDGTLFTGSLSGSTLSVSGTNPDGAGTTTTNVTGTVAAGCGSLSGTQTFAYSETGFSCSGNITFNATRTLGSGCGTAPTNTVVAEVEPNDTPGTAQPVTMPVAITGSMTQSTVADSWAITLSGTTVVNAMLTAPANQDIDLYIYDSTGATVLARSDTSSNNEAVAISLGAGSYRVVLFPFAVSGTANYTVVIQ